MVRASTSGTNGTPTNPKSCVFIILSGATDPRHIARSGPTHVQPFQCPGSCRNASAVPPSSLRGTMVWSRWTAGECSFFFAIWRWVDLFFGVCGRRGECKLTGLVVLLCFLVWIHHQQESLFQLWRRVVVLDFRNDLGVLLA